MPQRALEAVLGRFLQALRYRHRAYLSAETDLAEGEQLLRQGPIAEARARAGRRDRIRSRRPDAPDHVQEHVLVAELQSRMAMQHREQHGDTIALDADRDPARMRTAVVDERLNLDEQRTVPSHTTTTRSCSGRPPRCRKIADGFATSRMPRSVIANTPSSPTAPKRFLRPRSCGSANRRRPPAS